MTDFSNNPTSLGEYRSARAGERIAHAFGVGANDLESLARHLAAHAWADTYAEKHAVPLLAEVMRLDGYTVEIDQSGNIAALNGVIVGEHREELDAVSAGIKALLKANALAMATKVTP